MTPWRRIQTIAAACVLFGCAGTTFAVDFDDDLFFDTPPATPPAETKAEPETPVTPATTPATTGDQGTTTPPPSEATPAPEEDDPFAALMAPTPPAATEAATTEAATEATPDTAATPTEDDPFAALSTPALTPTPEPEASSTDSGTAPAMSNDTTEPIATSTGDNTPTPDSTDTTFVTETPSGDYPEDPALVAPTTDQPAPPAIGMDPAKARAAAQGKALAEAVRNIVPTPPPADPIITVAEELERSVATVATLTPERRAQLDEALASGNPARLTALAAEYAKELRHPMFGDASRARDALIILGKYGADAAMKELNTPDRLTRMLAIAVINKAGTDLQVATLVDLLTTTDPAVRYHAIMALRERFAKDLGYSHQDLPYELEAGQARWKAYLTTAMVQRLKQDAAIAAQKAANAVQEGTQAAEADVATKTAPAEAPVSAKKATAPATLLPEQTLKLNLLSTGKVTLNGQDIDPDQLETLLTAEKEKALQTTLVISADKDVPFSGVSSLIDMATRIGIDRMTFSVRD